MQDVDAKCECPLCGCTEWEHHHVKTEEQYLQLYTCTYCSAVFSDLTKVEKVFIERKMLTRYDIEEMIDKAVREHQWNEHR